MRSSTLPIYKNWLATATPAQVELADEIYAACEEHYEAGGDVVVECMSPADLLGQFQSVNDARDFCRLKIDQAKDARWGEDSDTELHRPHW